eukprot:11742310-Ditylum_brightwellii.AAC.1
MQKKSSLQRKNITLVAKGGDAKVKVINNNTEESSYTMLLAMINDSTDVGVVDDRREKRPPDDCVPLFDPNKMPQNKNLQVENEKDIEVNNYLLGCADMASFEAKLNTHFITYFEGQDVDTRLCGLHSLNNASDKRTFKEEILWNIQQRAHHHINDLVTDEMEVD